MIPCQDCDKSSIGKAKRKFATRMKEHQKAVEHKRTKKSALAEHCLRLGKRLVSWFRTLHLLGIFQDPTNKFKLAQQMPFRGMEN